MRYLWRGWFGRSKAKAVKEEGPPEEAVVTLSRACVRKPWGVVLRGLRGRGIWLESVSDDSPAAEAKCTRLLRWRLTRVDGSPVATMVDVVMKTTELLRVSLTFEPPDDDEAADEEGIVPSCEAMPAGPPFSRVGSLPETLSRDEACDIDEELPGEAPVERSMSVMQLIEDERSPNHDLRIKSLLEDGAVVDVGLTREMGLRSLTWNGIPTTLRAECWKYLVGYLPPTKERKESDLRQKRAKYAELVRQYWEVDDRVLLPHNCAMRKQILLDVPRMQPSVGLFRVPRIQTLVHRILFLWGVRRPASGYVQGMDGLLAPFVAVLVAEGRDFASLLKSTPEECEQLLDSIGRQELLDLEGDAYWCLSVLLDHIQNYYTPSQPGVQLAAFKVESIVDRVDPELHSHIKSVGADYLRDIMWRWSTCLLAREIPLALTVRLWDTYLSDLDGCQEFHIFVCVAFLLHWRAELLKRDFAEMMIFLRSLHTQPVSRADLQMWLSQAYMYQRMYTDSSHLNI